MIGKIIIGKSFRGCISYCLDKKEAELLNTNLCYGNKKELISQFNEVRRLNQNLSKPVQHITISLAKGEQLDNARLVSIAEDCAKDLGFEKNQYIVIAHHDTGHQHIHIVANRVSFDGKTVKDNHNYRKMAVYCRKMEEKHGLQKVLSPRRYLPKEQRNLPRTDQRKEKLRQDIKQCLAILKNYAEFELQIKKLGYQVNKARGIAFVDPQKVRVKGSEVGYSLSKIEKILSLQPEQKIVVMKQDQLNEGRGQPIQQQIPIIRAKNLEKDRHLKEGTEILLKPTPQQENINPALLRKKRQKKRRLEEQKKETIANAEMVSIVKRVLDKLEVMEQLIQPKDGPAVLERLRAIQIACQDRLEKSPLLPTQTTQVQTVIKYYFYFKTTAVIATSFFIVIIILSMLYLGKRKELNTHQANDIKYRYLKLNSSPNFGKILRLTDSLYLFDPDSMRKKVVWMERQQQEQLELSGKTNKQEQPEKQAPKETDKKRLSK